MLTDLMDTGADFLGEAHLSWRYEVDNWAAPESLFIEGFFKLLIWTLT